MYLSKSLSLILQHALNRCFQHRQAFLNGLPHQFCVHNKLETDPPIAHNRYFAPGDAGILLSQILWDVLHGLTDDFESADHGADGLVVRLKCDEVHAPNEEPNAFNGC
jgi:hypothetical protein